MEITLDDKKVAYLVAKLPLKTREVREHIEELLKILKFQKKEFESPFEDPENNLWEHSLLTTYFEEMLSVLSSARVRIFIRDLEVSWKDISKHLKNSEK